MQSVEQLIEVQQSFYSAKAEEYVDWIKRYMDPVRPRIEELVRSSPLRGSVLELAPGTGYWTETLSDIADDVTAIDGSAEMLDIVARRGLANVTLVQADLFTWTPQRRWDHIFFVHWLAHVPADRLRRFWDTLDEALEPGGKVIFVDVTAEEQAIEDEVGEESSVPTITRSLDDGRRFTVVKHYWKPEVLLALVSGWGWSGRATAVARDEGRGFVYYIMERSCDL